MRYRCRAGGSMGAMQGGGRMPPASAGLPVPPRSGSLAPHAEFAAATGLNQSAHIKSPVKCRTSLSQVCDSHLITSVLWVYIHSL